MTKSEFEQSDDKVEAAHLVEALRDPVGWPQPSEGFAERCLAAIRFTPDRAGESGRQAAESGRRARPATRRWLKVAASVAAMVCFVGLAAVVGRVVGGRLSSAAEPGGPTSVSATGGTEAVPSEIAIGDDVISQKGGNTMIARKMAGVVGAAVVSVAVSAAELTSEPTLVFMRPETSSFWNTATNNTMTVPVDFPPGATTATLTVSGVGYSATYADIEKGTDSFGTDSFTFALPSADSPQTENVYDLTLTFNDGTVRRAKLGLIEGLSPNAEGTTRCLAPENGRVWSKVKGGRAVLPIPHGTTSFSVTVNGETRTEDTGLNGAQGWYALGLHGDEAASLSMIANGLSYSVSLLGLRDGFVVVFQ
ncbi:MAG: hypothetical protein IKO55_01105 [Kiritimatiellae bacterium]|nr:hypothetical protein [Kiritimatiellia bacterium]